MRVSRTLPSLMKKVFDVSQTSGRPLPQLAEDLTGDVRQYEAFLEGRLSLESVQN